MNMMGGHIGNFVNCYGFNGPSGYSQFGIMPYFNFATLTFLALIAVGVYLFSKTGQPPIQIRGNTQAIEAEEMAKLRYARGEITFEEFLQILRTIRS